MDERNYTPQGHEQEDYFAQGQQYVNDNYDEGYKQQDYSEPRDFQDEYQYDREYRPVQPTPTERVERTPDYPATPAPDRRERVRPPRQQQRHVPPRRTQSGSVDRTAFVDQANRLGIHLLMDLRALFNKMFTSQPMQAFKVKISGLTVGILLALEILFGALIWGRLLSAIGNSGASLLQVLGIANRGVKIFGVGFGYGLLQMLVVMLLTILLVFLSGILVRSRKAGWMDYLRTVVVAATPKLCGSLVVLIISIFAPYVALGLMLTLISHYYIYLYAGIKHCHETEKSSPYWLFLIFIFVHYFLFSQTLQLIIKSVLTAFKL